MFSSCTSQHTIDTRNGREFNGIIPYIVLAGIMGITCFQHILVARFNTFSVTFIEAMVCSLLIWNKGRIQINKKITIIFGTYMLLTLVCLAFVYREFHYDFIKIVKNIVNTTLKIYSFAILWDAYGRKKIDSISSKIFIITVLVQGLYYVMFRMGNSSLRKIVLSNSNAAIIQDNSGRFQGSLAEPSYMGFWIGVTIFLVVLHSEKKYRYLLVIGLMYILFFDCKAKFSLIAFPLAMGGAVYIKAKRTTEIRKGTVVICVVIWMICTWVSTEYAMHIFGFISKYFGNSITYATRFFFLLGGFRESVHLPLGTGFGLNYEYFFKVCNELLPIIQNSGMDIREIYRYAYVSGCEAGFASKESLSYVLSVFGVPGFVTYLMFFKKTFQANYDRQYICRALIGYIFLESCFTVNLFDIGMFPFFIMSIMVVNKHKVAEE